MISPKSTDEKCVHCGCPTIEYEIGDHPIEGRVCCKCVVDNFGGWDMWHTMENKTGKPDMFKRSKEQVEQTAHFMDKYNRGKKK